MSLNLKELEAVFFAGMLQGWIAGNNGTENLDRPGTMEVWHFEGDFRMLDSWTANAKTGKSFGNTTIWHKGQPVWYMQYRGRYSQKAIPFLMQALSVSYSARQFVGGRGPQELLLGDYKYTNHADLELFRKFVGREKITAISDGNEIGYHIYAGGILL